MNVIMSPALERADSSRAVAARQQGAKSSGPNETQDSSFEAGQSTEQEPAPYIPVPDINADVDGANEASEAARPTTSSSLDVELSLGGAMGELSLEEQLIVKSYNDSFQFDYEKVQKTEEKGSHFELPVFFFGVLILILCWVVLNMQYSKKRVAKKRSVQRRKELQKQYNDLKIKEKDRAEQDGTSEHGSEVIKKMIYDADKLNNLTSGRNLAGLEAEAKSVLS